MNDTGPNRAPERHEDTEREFGINAEGNGVAWKFYREKPTRERYRNGEERRQEQRDEPLAILTVQQRLDTVAELERVVVLQVRSVEEKGGNQ